MKYKYKEIESLIVYVITYGPKSTRSPLGDTPPSKKTQTLENVPALNSADP